MAQVVYSERAFDDFERIFEFLAEEDPTIAALAVTTIQEAVSILERHPLIGRPVESELRELVISRGKTGYLALYSYLEAEDVVLVLAATAVPEQSRDVALADSLRPLTS